MRRGPFLIASVLTGISYLGCEGLSLSTNPGCIPPCTTTASRNSHDAANRILPVRNKRFLDRRLILQSVVPTMIGLVSTPPAAQALKSRNEMLCGTGFFTNIAQYKCTEIGDISQDGKVQSLTSTEEGSIQSLLDKLGVDTTTTTVITEDDAEGDNDGDSKLDKSRSKP